MASKITSRPKLRTMDDIYGLTESLSNKDIQNTQEVIIDDNGIKVSFKIIELSNLLPYSKHPFTLYDGERLSDMVESIKSNGVMNPILVRKDKQSEQSEQSEQGEQGEKGEQVEQSKQNRQCEQVEQGQQDEKSKQSKQSQPSAPQLYEILSGHNRVHASKIAGLNTIRAVIIDGLTDEEVHAYVIETNLIQRSFSDMKHSEKAAVIAQHHAKMFSQGKRTDIAETLEQMKEGNIPAYSHSNDVIPDDFDETEYIKPPACRWSSVKIVGDAYGLSKNSVSRYLRVNLLIDELKDLLDKNIFGVQQAVILSYLTTNEQFLVFDVCAEHRYLISVKQAETLRETAKSEALTEKTVIDILNNTKLPPLKRMPVYKFKNDVFIKYFNMTTTQDEVEEIVDEALQYYFEVGPGSARVAMTTMTTINSELQC